MPHFAKQFGALQGSFANDNKRIEALKRIIPRLKIQAILQKHDPDQRRCSKCPSSMILWLVIAMGLFGGDCYRQIFRVLNKFRRGQTPTSSAIGQARRRLGIAPLREMYQWVVRLLCKSDTPGAFYRGMRLIAIDGFVLDLEDTEANRRAFGKPKNGGSEGAFPQARIVALCEVGSHVLFAVLIKPIRCGEVTMARYLYRFLPAGSLLTFDINFFTYDLVQRALAQNAQFLGRSKTGRILVPIQVLEDGTYLAKIYANERDRRRNVNGLIIRVIEYELDDPQRTGHQKKHRLVTSLLDATEHDAEELILLYHERWEEEIAIDEVKTHQRERPVLRSKNPDGVVQEIYGYLIAHFLVRKLMFEAAEQAETAPRRISFVGALKILRCRLPEAPRSRVGLADWYRRLVQEVSEEVLPPRRNRINPRVIKKPQSKWPKARPEHRKLPKLKKEFSQTIVLQGAT